MNASDQNTTGPSLAGSATSWLNSNLVGRPVDSEVATILSQFATNYSATAASKASAEASQRFASIEATLARISDAWTKLTESNLVLVKRVIKLETTSAWETQRRKDMTKMIKKLEKQVAALSDLSKHHGTEFNDEESAVTASKSRLNSAEKPDPDVTLVDPASVASVDTSTIGKSLKSERSHGKKSSKGHSASCSRHPKHEHGSKGESSKGTSSKGKEKKRDTDTEDDSDSDSDSDDESESE